MPIKQKLFVVFIAISICAMIFELIRRGKLREEYSWLWILTGCVIIALTIWHELLEWITKFIGVISPVSALFFLSIIFLMMVCIQFSERISKLTKQVKNLTQELTILSAEIEQRENNRE